MSARKLRHNNVIIM